MTPEERDRFVKGMARIAQSNSIKMIEGMSEQVGKELREELKRQKAATRMQQEQIMTQQGQIQQLTELVNSLHGGVPPLLEAITGAKEKGGRGGDVATELNRQRKERTGWEGERRGGQRAGRWR
jgi:chromosome condensin MukBEF ATPase and DNA-binding subunit MukB